MRRRHLILILAIAAGVGLAACDRADPAGAFDPAPAMERLRAAQVAQVTGDQERLLAESDQAIVLAQAGLEASATARRIVLAAHQMAAEAHLMAGRPDAAEERIAAQQSQAAAFLVAHPEDGLLRELLAGYWLERALRCGSDEDAAALKERGWRVLSEAADRVLPEGFAALARRAAGFVAAEQAAGEPAAEGARSALAVAFIGRLRARPEWSALELAARTEILHVEGALRVRAGDLEGARACLAELEAADPGALQALRLEQLIRTASSGG